MKNALKKIDSDKHLLAFIMTASLMLNAASVFAQEIVSINVSPKVTSITNPEKSYGIQIGDKLTRKIVLDIPMPYKIASDAFPKKSSKNNGIELVEINVEAEQQKTHTLYRLALSYQVFAHSNAPSIMALPAVKFNLTGGERAMAIDLPAWHFWFSPLVTGGIETAQQIIQPEFKPPLVDINTHQTRLALFLTMLVISLVTLLYINADAKWLPFMGGAFAKAHRQIKRLAKSSGVKTAGDEKQALVYLHQAFNQHYRANIFARDINHFVSMHPSFIKIKHEIGQFFNESNQSLYAVEVRNSAQLLENLVTFSKQLRDCERGI